MLICPYLLINSPHKSLIIFQSFPLIAVLALFVSVSLPPPHRAVCCLPASSIACFVSPFNEQLDSFISLQVLDLPYHPPSL